ncbi:hypothetical protein HPB51_010236 [Rhipicephalus microplus]|uniref:Uncharacterized protein n=1 Tax=Rhipicephalus microplus TaxID=6941 RepID=A0A9J6EH28_RHIMP|nr:hypothetical protein HPB51_010236 [Rhipicephalus microplus]
MMQSVGKTGSRLWSGVRYPSGERAKPRSLRRPTLGMLALNHSMKKHVRGRFLKKSSGDLGLYSLTRLWAEPSFDAPSQLWKAVSQQSFKDYSGLHELELVPCVAAPAQDYRIPPEDFCTPLEPLSLYVGPHRHPLAFNLVDVAGETLFGRVLWNPLEELSASLRIDQVYLCTGKAGFTPSFDPTGHELARTPSFGCVQPSPNLEHRFLILDRSNPDHVDDSVAGVSFKAKLAEEDSLTRRLRDYPGVDGFFMLVDPLYETPSGGQWYLQVLYSVVPHGRGGHRQRRVVTRVSPSNDAETATDMHSFRISHKSHRAGGTFTGTALAAGSSALLVLLLSGWATYRYRRAVVASTAATSAGARNGGHYAALQDHHHHCRHHNPSSSSVRGVRVLTWHPVIDTTHCDATEV